MADAIPQAVVDECVGNAHGNLARVRELVDQHPEVVNARATWGETPIEAATQMGNRPIIDFLIERGAPVDFFTACVLGDADRVRADLAADPGCARVRGIHDLPTLYFAAIGGSRPVAELLLASGAGVNDRCQAKSAYPRCRYSATGPERRRWLLERDADPGGLLTTTRPGPQARWRRR